MPSTSEMKWNQKIPLITFPAVSPGFLHIGCSFRGDFPNLACARLVERLCLLVLIIFLLKCVCSPLTAMWVGSCTQTVLSGAHPLTAGNKIGCQGRARTYDRLINSQLLYLLSYLALLGRTMGIEPTTTGITIRGSTI